MRQIPRPMQRSGGGAIVCCALFLLIPLTAAWSQGFMVKPMRVDVQARAGASTTVPVEVRNSLGVRQPVVARQVDLGQDQRGSWAVMSEEDALDQPRLRSCRDWMSLEEDRLELGPYAAREFQLALEVPRGARGTYAAGLLVRSEEPDTQGAIAVVIQFLIPVIVQVEGVSARERVSFSDVELVQKDDDGVKRDAALVAHLSNDGETLVRVGGGA